MEPYACHGPDLGLDAPHCGLRRRRGRRAVTQLSRGATLSAVDVDLGESGRDPHRDQGQVGTGGADGEVQGAAAGQPLQAVGPTPAPTRIRAGPALRRISGRGIPCPSQG